MGLSDHEVRLRILVVSAPALEPPGRFGPGVSIFRDPQGRKRTDKFWQEILSCHGLISKTLDKQHQQLSHLVVSLSIVLTVPQPTGFFFSWLVVSVEAQLIKAKSPNIRQATINAFFMEKPSIFS